MMLRVKYVVEGSVGTCLAGSKVRERCKMGGSGRVANVFENERQDGSSSGSVVASKGMGTGTVMYMGRSAVGRGR